MSRKKREPQWRRQSPDARREAILEVAARHFAEKPYEQVSTIDIAKEAGGNRGLIHHYIGTKRDLYIEVMKSNLQIPSFPRLGHVEDPASLEQALSAAIYDWLDEIADAPRTWLNFQRVVTGAGNDPEVEQLIREAREATLLEALEVRFGATDLPPAALGWMSALAALTMQALVEWLELGRLNRQQTHGLLLHTALSLWFNVGELFDPAPAKPAAAPRKRSTRKPRVASAKGD